MEKSSKFTKLFIGLKLLFCQKCHFWPKIVYFLFLHKFIFFKLCGKYLFQNFFQDDTSETRKYFLTKKIKINHLRVNTRKIFRLRRIYFVTSDRGAILKKRHSKFIPRAGPEFKIHCVRWQLRKRTT